MKIMKKIKNINKSIVILVLSIIFMFVFIIKLNENSEIEKIIVNNYSHKNTDIEFLIDDAIEYFSNIDVHIYEVRYDENQSLEKAWAEETGGETIILSIDFKTDFFENNKGLSPNQKYLDYSIIYTKDGEGAWKIYDMGYH